MRNIDDRAGDIEDFEQNSIDLGSDDRFSEHDELDDEEAATHHGGSSRTATRMLGRRQFTKLEVVQARQIEKLLLSQHIVTGIGFLWTIVVVILMRTKYARPFSPPEWDGHSILVFETPRHLEWFTQIAAFLVFAYIVCLAATFTFRILWLSKLDRTHEQIWVIALLISLSVYLFPWEPYVRIHDNLLKDHTIKFPLYDREWFKEVQSLAMVLRTTAFTASTLFYLWASLHSYRLLNGSLGILFYLPKILVLFVYVATRIMVTYIYQITPAEMLFTNFFGMLSTYGEARRWPRHGIVFGVSSLLMELALGIVFIREVVRTKSVLKKVDYLKHRTKQIGFRFFVYHNMTFYCAFWCMNMMLLLGLPHGLKAFDVLIRGASHFEVHDFKFGIQLMLISYATVEAYANLPADALGFKGWFVPQIPGVWTDTTELAPITYRKREPPSLKGAATEVNANCFVMQTHVTMFNFAWLVYYWDTPKVEDFKLTQDVFKFSVAQYIKDKPTDTHVLVVDGVDRIVIAFKGTTSTKNLKTDINMFYSNARSLLPTRLGEDDPEGDADALRNPILRNKLWRWAKVHKGFATAYGAVGPELLATVKRLQSEHRRPVFLTGHSLGGALATVCSLDLHMRLGMTRREIFVSTFGAPRVGNRSFQRIYDDNVPIHWRIVVGPDVVAKLPKIGFSHVGKKVLITVDGDLFIDPNSLELNLWSGDVASILYHRKASYLLAMRAWCERHHGDEYLPEFWPFPVSKDDTRRFEHAMVRTRQDSFGEYSDGRGQHHGQRSRVSVAKTKRTRMREIDAMIEALDDGVGEAVGNEPECNMEAIQRWAHFTTRLLELGPPRPGYDLL